MTRSVAFATYAARPEGEPDDHAAASVLRDRGVAVDFVVWNDASATWSEFDAVVVRSTWDYFHHLDAFLSWAERVAAQTHLLNPLPVIQANVEKTYLRDLEQAGIPIVPTWWPQPGEDLAETLDALGLPEAVVKPAVSGGAFETFRVCVDDAHASQARFAALLDRGAVLVQPFLPQIATGGEWSLVFFDGAYSHAVLKRPRTGDFRVQPRLGGKEAAATPTPDLIRQAEAALATLPDPPLYARVDGVVHDGVFLLMELELVEPSLFLRHGEAAGRFADALTGRLT